jgi:DNA-binding transcriptional regulator LsrR (DeoR family)
MNTDPASEDRKVTLVVNAFRQGKNTVEIAEKLNLKEAIVERMLHAGLAVDRLNKIRGKTECH